MFILSFTVGAICAIFGGMYFAMGEPLWGSIEVGLSVINFAAGLICILA